ncbi:MAG: PfkB family carbohydrate kinase [Legionella sp.]|nr:PfkB family carbohydrate kinase [Legionella sp.]
MTDMDLAIEQKAQHSNIFTSFDALNQVLDKYRDNTKIVHCHGVFDLLHIGHIRHFKAAREFGDILVVSLTPDIYVNKGSGRPAFTEQLRAEAIASLDCVDYVVINTSPIAVEAIQQIRPDFYIKGDEYADQKNDITGKINVEREAIESVGGVLAFTSDLTFSSSNLINRFFSPYSEEMQHFLNEFKKQYTADAIFDYLEQAKDLKVLVVGEVIIDAYHFTDVIGKAGKEPTLVAKKLDTENYLGGSLALANHLSDFCQKVTCLTYLGEKNEHDTLIKKGLKHNIDVVPIYKTDSPTIVKHRYLDKYLKQKLFEVYEINDDFLEPEQEQAFQAHINRLTDEHDLVICIDYGHGLLTDESIQLLTDKAKFLAINAQSNAGNMGFNCISKYPSADFVSIANRELQLNYRQKHLSSTEQMSRLMEEHDYQKVMVTCGKYGAYACQQGEAQTHVPAFTNQVVDRVGAGDAVLAISSLFAYLDAPSLLIAFIGNVVGSEAVGMMGNKSSIEKVPLMKHLSHLLK